jgi:hypothetical protein
MKWAKVISIAYVVMPNQVAITYSREGNKMKTFDWDSLGKPRKRKCFCGKTDRLIPYCGYYICVWCRTGLKQVPRVMSLNCKLRKAN